MTTAPQKRSSQTFSISDLALIVNREIGTIRKWDSRLPKHLQPKREGRNRRYWTHAQVYGRTGIIAWMKRNNMRPGNTMTTPDQEAAHVAKLRKPKFLNNVQISIARAAVKDGQSAQEIVDYLFPETMYASKENLDEVLRRYFTAQGWDYPSKIKAGKNGDN